MRSLESNPNVDLSNLVDYPNGRIKDNTGAGDGTAVNERVKGDFHQMIEKTMRLYGITPNNLPDNETNGFQIVEALIALASKNDYILNLGSTSGVLSVPVKLGFMLDNESIICKATVDLGAETTIKGSDATTFGITVFGSFKANEYVRLIKTGAGVTLVRIADSVSLDLMVSEFLYLKKASQAQENAGAIDTKATTPLSNLTAFIRRVNGADSATYLATASINGIYPKEHFAIVAALGTPIERNYGTINGYNPNTLPVGSFLPVTGDIASAQYIQNFTDGDIITITLANPMDSTNYEVDMTVESLGVIEADRNIGIINFKVLTTTTFNIAVFENSGTAKSLKIHFSVKQR